MTRDEARELDERERWFSRERGMLLDELVRSVATRLHEARCYEELNVLCGMSPDELATVAFRESQAIHTGNPQGCAPIATHGVSGSIGLTQGEAA